MPNPSLLDVAKLAARSAGDVLKQYHGSAEVSFKAGESQNLVTQADLEAERAILHVINQAFPDHEVLGEEGLGTADLSAEHLWVVDPLDGTTNYAQGIPQYCTAVSFVAAGQIQVGVVLDPNRNEMFHAVRGAGAFLNDSRIRVSERSELDQAVVATGFYYDRGEMMKRTLHSIEALFGFNIRGIRRFGGAALDQCWVACGRLDAFFEYQLSPWDYAAASLIVDEAGGRCSDRNGCPLTLASQSLIASNAELFDAIVAAVRWDKESQH